MYKAECFGKYVCGGGGGGGVSANEGRILRWGAPTLKIQYSYPRYSLFTAGAFD